VVMMIGMIQLDGLDGYWAHYGPITEEFVCYAFLICTRPSTISSLVYFVLGRVGPLLCFMNMLGYDTLYLKSLYPLNIM